MRALFPACFLLMALGGALAESYTVRSGDTLYSISQKLGTDPGELVRINHLNSSTIQVGQRLQIPAVRATLAAGGLERGLFVPTWNSAQRVTLNSSQQSGLHLQAASSASLLQSFMPGSFGLRPWQVPFEPQTYNNCGPASVAAVLRFYGLDVNQKTFQNRLRPGGGYMTVPPSIKLFRELGLKATAHSGGTPEQLIEALKSGPVIVLQWHSAVGKVPHFRVVTGFNVSEQIFYMSDPLSGPFVALTKKDFVSLWGTQGRQWIEVKRG